MTHSDSAFTVIGITMDFRIFRVDKLPMTPFEYDGLLELIQDQLENAWYKIASADSKTYLDSRMWHYFPYMRGHLDIVRRDGADISVPESFGVANALLSVFREFGYDFGYASDGKEFALDPASFQFDRQMAEEDKFNLDMLFEKGIEAEARTQAREVECA